jgi:hypothetical protein
MARSLLIISDRRFNMANDSGGSTGFVAIFAIVIMLGIAGFIAWRAGVFGASNGDSKSIDVNLNTESR